MALWRFVAYQTEQGKAPAEDWYRKLDDGAKAAILAAVAQLENRPTWREPWFVELTRGHSGLSEIRAWKGKTAPSGKDRKFRFFGHRLDESRTYVIFAGCEKFMNGVTDPPGADDEGLFLKGEFEAGKGSTHDFSFD